MNAGLAIRAMDRLYQTSRANRAADAFGRAARWIKPDYQVGKSRRIWASRVTEDFRPPHLQISIADGLPLGPKESVKIREIFSLVQGGEVAVIAGEAAAPKVEFLGEALRVTVADGFLSSAPAEEVRTTIGEEIERMLMKKRTVLEILGFGHDEWNTVTDIFTTAAVVWDCLGEVGRDDLIREVKELSREVFQRCSNSISEFRASMRSGQYSGYDDYFNRVENNRVVAESYQAMADLKCVLEALLPWSDSLIKARVGKIRRMEPDGSVHEFDLGRSAQRLERMIYSIRDHLTGVVDSIKGEVAFEQADLRETLTKYLSTVKRAEVKFIDHLGPAPLAKINVSRLLRLLENLINNAAEAMMEHQHQLGQVTVWAAIRDEKVRLIISDTGPAGIPPRILEEVTAYQGRPVQQIFIPGERGVQQDAQAMFASTRGLGGWIIRSVVEELGGVIRASNVPLKGGRTGGQFVVEF